MSNLRVNESYEDAIDVTPSDTVNIAHPSGQSFTMGLYVAVAGDVSVLLASGRPSVFSAVPAGFHRLSVQRVNATLTTATGIKALY